MHDLALNHIFLCPLADVSAALRQLLLAVDYEGKTVADLPYVLMEVDPEDVQWLKVCLLLLI